MNNQLIPFGKYKGQPLEAIMEDKQYIDWLLAQSWVREKYNDFYTIIINNFQDPTDTPQHNAMHVRFLNDAYILSTLSKCQSDVSDYFVDRKSFEDCGWDVIVELINHPKDELLSKTEQLANKLNNQYCLVLDKQLDELQRSVICIRFCIEIKPTVSDDFPSILRQIKSSIEANRRRGNTHQNTKTHVILLVGEYTGAGATQEEFVAFMNTENITVIFDSIAD